MPPKAARHSRKNFSFDGGDKMVFLVDFSFPSEGEVKYVQRIAEDCFEFLDGRELWIFENFCEVSE
jgi:hypothetical protein